MIPDDTMGKLWKTWMVKVVAWILVSVAIIMNCAAGERVCDPGFYPFWLQLYGWSNIATGLAVAFVTIWFSDLWEI